MNENMSAVCHPSLWQTPVADAELNAHPSLLATTDPRSLWSQKATSRDSTEPPMSATERRNSLGRLVPATRIRAEDGANNLLLRAFMSRQNAEYLHKVIIRLVHDFSGFPIGRQSDQKLTDLMSSVYKAHAVHVNEETMPRSKLIRHVREEVSRLDTIVAQSAVPSIVNAVEQHVSFLSALEKPRNDDALIRPENTNTKGTRAV